MNLFKKIKLGKLKIYNHYGLYKQKFISYNDMKNFNILFFNKL